MYICIVLPNYFLKFILLFFQFLVDDNFESTSDDAIVSVEPKQADPSSQYYIDGLDPDDII